MKGKKGERKEARKEAGKKKTHGAFKTSQWSNWMYV